MEFMEKLGEIKRKVSHKAGEIVEMGKTGAKIHSETAETDDLKKQIGEICFGKFRSGDPLDPEIEKICIAIEKHKRSIAENQRKLDRLKETDRRTGDSSADGFCPSCGKKIGKEASFCAHCGQKLSE